MQNRYIAHVICFVLFACLSCFSVPLWAAPITVLANAPASVSVETHLDFLPDPDGNISIEDVASPAYAGQFRNTGAASFTQKLTTDVYWLRVPILNQADAAHPWFLQLYGQEDAAVAVYLQADLPSVATPPIHLEPQPYFLYHTYPLPLAAQTAYTLYIRLHNETAALLGNAHFKQTDQRVNIHRVVFYALLTGCLLALGVYNGVLAFNLRDRNFAWLALFILAMMLKLNQYTGLLPQYIRVSEPYVVLYSVLGYLCVISYLAFFRQLLETHHHLPYLDKVLTGTFWLAVVMMLGSPWLPFDLYSINVLAMLSAIITLLAVWRLRRLQIPRIHKLNWAFFALIGGLLPTVLATLGVPLEFNSHLHFALSGVVLFVLLLSVVQADQARASREQLARVHATGQAKSDFLTTMSHELRTPMNTVVGTEILLRHTELTPQQQSYVDKLAIASKHMLALVNNILDVARIEQQGLALEHIPFELCSLLNDLHTLLEEQASAKHLHLSVQHSLPDATWLLGDPTRLKQVLLNLLGNAIKFTEQGDVTLKVLPTNTNDTGSLTLSFSVTDTGIGLSEEQQRHLFQPFSQADNSTARRYGGSGLGLVISQRLVQQMGGELTLDSSPNRGSCFRFTLSFPRSKPLAGRKVVLPPLRPAHILLVDDDELNQFFSSSLLETLGMTVTVAGCGIQAIAQVQQQTFDLVLMDVSMPEMDGYETTRQIRTFKLPYTLPIIALTAHAIEGERERCLAAGMNDYLSKPFAMKDLQGMLQCWLR